MARLPISGSDNGTWGNILNDFLRVAHNADGTLKDSMLTSQEFSHGATLIDPIVANVVIWQAAFNCTVTKVSAYRVGGGGATINARKNGSSTFLVIDLSVSTTNNWMSGGTLQNATIAAGDSLEIMVTTLSGSPTQLAIQIDFVLA